VKGVSNPKHVELWPCDAKGTPLGSDSEFYHSTWKNRRRITSLDPSIQKTVAPNQTARFVFTLRAPNKPGINRLYVIPTLAGKAHPASCFNGAHFYFDVKPNSCSGASSQACGPCSKGSQTRVCSNGVWSGWSACTGAGCTPKSSKACGSGASQTCDNKCQWAACKGTTKVYRFIWNGIKGGQARRDHFYQLISTTPPSYTIENSGTPVFLTSGNSQSGKMAKIWRLYMGDNCLDHYYTIDTKEKDSLVAKGWKLDNPNNIGYCSVAQTTGSTPLYQTYNANLCDHFYTVSKAERDLSIKNGYNTSVRTICHVWSP